MFIPVVPTCFMLFAFNVPVIFTLTVAEPMLIAPDV